MSTPQTGDHRVAGAPDPRAGKALGRQIESEIGTPLVCGVEDCTVKHIAVHRNLLLARQRLDV